MKSTKKLQKQQSNLIFALKAYTSAKLIEKILLQVLRKKTHF